MAGGTIALQTVAGFLQYMNQKAGTETGLAFPVSDEIKAYTSGDGKHIILPFTYQFKMTLPTNESDGLTASNKTFIYLNRFRLPIKVTYSGNAKA